MSKAFRELLKKVGSGTHTSKDLTRSESAAAMRMMLLEEATPAQIGAFLIAHRIKRPTPEELAGMLDAYDQLGPTLAADNMPWEQPVTVFGNPYDGRSRTAPVTPITALILAAAQVPVILHGGNCMPTKYGVPLVEMYQGLGVDFTKVSLSQAQNLLATTGLSLIYLPHHFPLADKLVTYRDQIGKRPPLATLELIWLPYLGKSHIIAGFVHPPTEDRFCQTFKLRNIHHYTTVKGLEGSCDLPRSRTSIIGTNKYPTPSTWQRLHIHPRDYGFAAKDVPLESTTVLVEKLQAIVAGKPIELMQDAIWNGGFYLWHCGVCPDLSAGLAKAEEMLIQGQVKAKIQEMSQQIASF